MDLKAQGVMQKLRSSTFFSAATLSVGIHIIVFLAVSFVFKNLTLNLKAKKKEKLDITIYATVPSLGSRRSDSQHPQKKKPLKKRARVQNEKPAPLIPTTFENHSKEATSTLNVKVEYPKLSRILREEGEVVFNVLFDNEKLKYQRYQSSGFARLDSAAERALLSNSELSREKLENITKIRFLFSLKGT